jgi:addiction module HigA family antidote
VWNGSVATLVTLKHQLGVGVVENRTDEAVHPGVLLRGTILPALNLSVSQTARDLGITRQTLHRILAGDAGITPDMAVRLEKLCGVPGRFWLQLQHMHELDRVASENGNVLARIPFHPLPPNVIRRIGAAHVR